MTAPFRIMPIDRAPARAFVAAHHSHHMAHVGEKFTLGGFLGHKLVAVSVLARPVAPELQDGETWEVTRLCCGPHAPRYAASRLLGASTRTAVSAGITLLVSYTRVDEPGTCYRAANWRPVAYVNGRPHDTGNRAARWLPGLYEPSTEIVDRIRWEYGPRARPPGCEWNGHRWSRRNLTEPYRG